MTGSSPAPGAPLNGIRVVELGVWIAGPAAAAMLADWGAEVIKVESEVGDPQRHVLASVGLGDRRLPPFEVDNRGKRSVVLDLKTPSGLADMERLLADADVFITNLRRGALADLDLDPESVRARHPALIYGLVTGYGSQGPDADRAAYDVAGFWARTGMANAFTQTGGSPPALPPSYGDHITAMSLVAGIGAALTARATTGDGRLVETSLMRTGLYCVAADLSTRLVNGRSGRTLGRHEAGQPLMNSYRCSDEQWLWLILLESERHWPKLVSALADDRLEDERFADGMGRFKNRRELIALLDELFASRTRDEWGAILDEHDVWWAAQNDASAVVEDPQVIAANGLVELPASDTLDAAMSIATPVDFDSQPISIRRASPQVGEHTAQVSAEFGLEST